MTKIPGLRWWIVALICSARSSIISRAMPSACWRRSSRREMAISTQQYSYIVGAFQIGYTIMQPVCGLIVDLIGLRLGFALFAALWSIAGCLHGGVDGLDFAGWRARPDGPDRSRRDPRGHEGGRRMVPEQGEIRSRSASSTSAPRSAR